ncbi:MAG: 50S ribosomal protein L29 [Chloroflexi bacterium]|nr:50S ribosomal protein L29 [Chloroflexota bacterium]
MKASELREMDYEDLLYQLDDLKEAYFNLRFQQQIGQLEDTNQLRFVRRNIARVQTVLREKELEAQRG